MVTANRAMILHGYHDKKQPGIKQIGDKASNPFGLMGIKHQQRFHRNSRESYLAGKYLQSIGSKCTKQQWQSLLIKNFNQAGTLLKRLKALYAILEEHEESTCQASYWKNKVNVSHSFSNNHGEVGAISKGFFSKKLS